MRLLEVVTPAQAREFLRFQARLYAAAANYVRPLDRDVTAVFDAAKNKYFRHGALVRWLLVDAAGRTLGRVAAFVNERTAHTFAQATGGLGFFECVDDQAAATVLFDAARDWLAARGMAAMAPSILGTATSGGACCSIITARRSTARTTTRRTTAACSKRAAFNAISTSILISARWQRHSRPSTRKRPWCYSITQLIVLSTCGLMICPSAPKIFVRFITRPE